MSGIVRAGVIGGVTRITTVIGKLIVPAGVARCTRGRCVYSCERKFGTIVIKCRRLPRNRSMAKLARRREATGNMVWRSCRCKLGLMTGVAQRRGRLVDAALMALLAHDGFVSPREGELREVVIETRLPGKRIHGMAVNAICRETCRRVIGVCR